MKIVVMTKISGFGINVADVQAFVQTAIGGMTVARSVEGLERYPNNVRYPREYRDSLERLRNLPIVTKTGAQIPLSRLVDISISGGPGVIRSENARLNGWIYVDIAGVDIGSYVQDAKLAYDKRYHINLVGYSCGVLDMEDKGAEIVKTRTNHNKH